MAKLNIEGWPTSGREALLQRYRDRLREIHDAAGELAVTEYLQQFKD
jgi:hypothetical protein